MNSEQCFLSTDYSGIAKAQNKFPIFFQNCYPGNQLKYQIAKSVFSLEQRGKHRAHIITPSFTSHAIALCADNLKTQKSSKSELIEDYTMSPLAEGASPSSGVDNVGKGIAPKTSMTLISETAMRNSLRNQQLMEMRQLVVEVVGNEKSINIGQMHTLLCHRRFIQVFFQLFTEGKGDSLCQEKWLGQMKQWTGVRY